MELNLEELADYIQNTNVGFLSPFSNDGEKAKFKEFLQQYNYILSEKAEERINKLYTYIHKGVPVILEGETGSSKTLTAEIICKYWFKNKYIKFNLSADVRIGDLMRKFSGDQNSASGLKIVNGPFYQAFTEGIPLILDEINLASEEVLQCIEDILDSGEINIEISGIGLIKEKKKEGFCLIATQNPNKDKYFNKRQNLSYIFLSHFQIIKFPSFEKEELKVIGKQIFKNFNNQKEENKEDIKFIEDLIDFHIECQENPQIKDDDLICFTIREIIATIKAYIETGKKNPYKIIKRIYGSRYSKEKKDLFKKIEKYKCDDNEEFTIPKEMVKFFYDNQSLK